MFSTKDGLHDSEDVVGGPRDQEDQQNEGERLCCFSLLLLFLKRFDCKKVGLRKIKLEVGTQRVPQT